MKFNDILKFLVPKGNDFFPLFEGQANCIVKASELIMEVVNIKKSSEEKNEIFNKIKNIEHEGDTYTREISDKLSKSFITPFDSEDIHNLSTALDDVLDDIHAVSKRIQWYKPKYKKISDEWKSFASIINDSAKEIQFAIEILKDYSKKSEDIRRFCTNINDLERKADEIFYKYMSDLFDHETDPIEVIKKKDIILSLENTVNRSEDVSDIIKTILIKNV
jgi:predicted phosphate transport protein (TIGR00153 family)